MSEDSEFEDFLRERLEADVEVRPAALAEIRRMAADAAPARAAGRPWWRALPAAAAVLAVLGLTGVLSYGPERRAQGRAVEALQLLCEADDVVCDTAAANAADLLLAWQDAPYQAIEDEVLE